MSENTSGKLRPPVRWFGGKYYLASKIIALFPGHHCYVEPFGGGASVLLNKQPSAVEIYNDLNGRVVRLFRVLRDYPEEFRRLLTLTPYAEEEFDTAGEPVADEVEAARRDYVRWRMSFGAMGEEFAYSIRQSRRGMSQVVSAFLSSVDELLPKILERLRMVQILNRDAFRVIKAWDFEDTLFYCDPPYMQGTVSCPGVYEYNLSDAEHQRLLETLLACRGKVVISGYPSELYDTMLRDWRRIEFDMANHTAKADSKGRVREVVWLNY